MQRWFFWLPDLLLSSKIFVYSAGLIQLTPTEQVVNKCKVKLVVISDSCLMKTSWNELNSWLAAKVPLGEVRENHCFLLLRTNLQIFHIVTSYGHFHCPTVTAEHIDDRWCHRTKCLKETKKIEFWLNVSFHLRGMPTIPMAAASKRGEGGPCCSSYTDSRVGHWTHFRVNPSQLASSSQNLSSSASFILICDQPQGDR